VAAPPLSFPKWLPSYVNTEKTPIENGVIIAVAAVAALMICYASFVLCRICGRSNS